MKKNLILAASLEHVHLIILLEFVHWSIDCVFIYVAINTIWTVVSTILSTETIDLSQNPSPKWPWPILPLQLIATWRRSLRYEMGNFVIFPFLSQNPGGKMLAVDRTMWEAPLPVNTLKINKHFCLLQLI